MDWQNMLAFYERSVDDESASPEQKMLFARKANWLRVISRLQVTGRAVRGLQEPENSEKRFVNGHDSEAVLFSPTRLSENRWDFPDTEFFSQQKRPEDIHANRNPSHIRPKVVSRLLSRLHVLGIVPRRDDAPGL